MTKLGRGGFTIVELIMVLVILGLLAGLGMLKYIDLKATARTAALAGDVRSVELAVLNYHAEFETWPAEAGAGLVPTGLASFLPGGLNASFDRQFYMLDYQNIDLGGTSLIGVAVTSSDPRQLAKFISTFSGRGPFYLYGGALTYVISAPVGTLP
jgi:prepilin-type N-terminal cleavage/methylation domain-containing protein